MTLKFIFSVVHTLIYNIEIDPKTLNLSNPNGWRAINKKSTWDQVLVLDG